MGKRYRYVQKLKRKRAYRKRRLTREREAAKAAKRK